VRPQHFERLLYVKEAPALMQAALSAFYERNDAHAAIEKFREVLEHQPSHYGATYQLAKALDQDGKPAEAAVWWTKVLDAAELIGDTTTARQARERLAVRK
jgi:cytochrome c-type biogenesis protein CcmH/NrfG